MFDLSTISSDTPLAFVSLAVFYNIVRHALNLHHERKQEASEAATHERIVALSSQLASALEEIKYLKMQMGQVKEKAKEIPHLQEQVQNLTEKGA